MDDLLVLAGASIAGVALGVFTLSGGYAKLTPAKDASLIPPEQQSRIVDSSSQQLPMSSVNAMPSTTPTLNYASPVPSGLGAPNGTEEVKVSLTNRTTEVYRNGNLIKTYQIGIGSPDTPTPTGTFQVYEKEVNPEYHRSNGEVVPPGPGNPLGSRWIGFLVQGNGAWGFHGGDINTGSLGCIHMQKQDLEEMYEAIAAGAKVTIE